MRYTSFETRIKDGFYRKSFSRIPSVADLFVDLSIVFTKSLSLEFSFSLSLFVLFFSRKF